MLFSKDLSVRMKLLVGIGLLLAAAFLIYLPFELGAALTIPPDSSEYSICLGNLFEHGRFGFTLNGTWYPSRYAPWFSLLCLTPAYLLSGGNVLCSHWAILAFALILLIAVWKMGKMCGLGRLSILPPITLMFMPDFVFYSRVAMTEIPYAALFAVISLVFVRFVNKARVSARFCFCVGLLIAWIGLVRTSGFSLAIPFGVVVLLRRTSGVVMKDSENKECSMLSLSYVCTGWNTRLLLLSAIGLPILVALVVGMGYNWFVFGSPFRSGYNYWCAVPVDFPDLVFNSSYVIPMLKYLLGEPVIQITLIFLCSALFFFMYVIATKNCSAHRTFLLLVGFVLSHLMVLACLYLGYYWPDTRFYLSVTVCSVPLFFVAINAFLSKFGRGMRVLLTMVVFLLSVIAVSNAPTRYLNMAVGRPIWLAQSQITASVLPPKSIVVQSGDPNVLEYFGFGEKELRLFPFCREFDYVTYMVAPSRINHLVKKPESWNIKVIPELVRSGVCSVPFPDVFEERPELIKEYLSQGRRMFFVKDFFRRDAELEKFRSYVENMGLTLKLFGVWNDQGIAPNPVRHLYDRLIFPDYSMDSRPAIMVAYYEVVAHGG